MHLVQVAQHAADLDRAERFYSDLLGEPASARFDTPGLLFFDLDGVRLLLDRAAPSALIYLAVPDVRASVQVLRDQGVEVVGEPHVIFSHTDDVIGPAGTDEWMAFVTDSEANTIGLVSYSPSSPPT